jgi:hypothetical protein
MSIKTDNNWLEFSIDEKVRSDNENSRLVPLPDADEKTKVPGKLSYESYLRLDTLLNCQWPTSAVPDERLFITVHQEFEIGFKQMIFELGVIAATFVRLLLCGPSEFGRLTLSCDKETLEFWRPALTASKSLKLRTEKLLPLLMRFLGGEFDEDGSFSSVEFYRFRDNLFPASGFQSAQFRIIQRGFGKSALLSLRLFPIEAYSDSSRDRTTNVVDPRILGRSAEIATPTVTSPYG